MTGSSVTVIGSSPAVLMRALALVQEGHAVRVLERAEAPGGAWATPPGLGCDAVECAVHLLENRPDFYAALRAQGVVLEPETGASVLWRGKSLPMGPARSLFHTLVSLNALRQGKIDQSRRIATSALRSLANRGNPFLYPAQGSREIVQATLAALAQAGVRPAFGCAVERIVITTGRGARCETSLGPFESDRILVASRAHAPVVIDGVAFTPGVETALIRTLLLRGTRAEPSRFSYVEVLRDSIIKRVRDVSRFCRPALPADAFVLAVQLREPGLAVFRTEGTEGIVTRLEALGLISGTWGVLGSELHQYAYTTLTDASLRKLQRLSKDRVIPCPTADFADGFAVAQPVRKGMAK